MWDALASRSASVAATPDLGAGIESPAVPASPRRGRHEGRPAPPRHAEERERRHASPYIGSQYRLSQLLPDGAPPWSFESGSTSLHRAAAAPKGGRLPPDTRRGERVDMPLPTSVRKVLPSPCLLPEWTSLSMHLQFVALHLQPQPTIARVVVIARAARIPGTAAPRQGPPRREPRDRDPRVGSPPTRAYTTLRPEPDPSRPSAVASPYSDHRQFIVRVYRPSSTVRIPTADHVNAQYTPSSPHTQFLYQWRSLPITFIREERTRPDRFPDDGADTSAVASTRSQARSLPPARVASRPEIGLETAVVHDCFSRMWRSTIGAKPRLNAVRVHRGPRTTHSPWSRPITRPAEPRLTSALAV